MPRPILDPDVDFDVVGPNLVIEGFWRMGTRAQDDPEMNLLYAGKWLYDIYQVSYNEHDQVVGIDKKPAGPTKTLDAEFAETIELHCIKFNTKEGFESIQPSSNQGKILDC